MSIFQEIKFFFRNGITSKIRPNNLNNWSHLLLEEQELNVGKRVTFYFLFYNLSHCMDMLPYACITFLCLLMLFRGIYPPSLFLYANTFFLLQLWSHPVLFCFVVFYFFPFNTLQKFFLNHQVVLCNMVFQSLFKY